MDNRIDDNDRFSSLPLEVIGLVLKKLDEGNLVEELKKCKLISPRLYKATQVLLQDEFGQKLCTHFDGSKLNYTNSRAFGMNIFGSYKLNFPTVKISRAEYYLMKSWLEKLVPTNIQTLELKDNLLNWKEMIEVLGKFPKIVHLKYIQSSDDTIVADKIHNLYIVEDEEFCSVAFYKKIYELIQVQPEFLQNLKTFEAEVVNWNITNMLSLLLSKSQSKNLEKFAIKIDLFGIINSVHSKWLKTSRITAQLNSNQMTFLSYFEKFAKSLKSIEIIIDDSKLPQVEANFVKKSSLVIAAQYLCSHSVMYPFSEKILMKFDQLESLILISPILHNNLFLQRKCKLSQFIKKQKNLQNLEISYLDGSLGREYSNEQEAKFLKSLVIDHYNRNKKTRFGYQVGYQRTNGMANISQFSENLSALKMILIGGNTTWRFSDQNIPKFPNCLEMRIENFMHQNWDNYEFQSIIEKFQNLERLTIVSSNWQASPQVLDQDFQLIISGLPHLKMIHFEISSILNDSALTGLTSEAIEARKENFSEPIGPEDRTGLAISHLENLESLVIISKDFILEISDITAHHAFENMPKLKCLNLYYSNITQEGFESILEKTGSKNLNIVQLTTEQLPFGFHNEDDAVDDNDDM